MKPSPIHLPLNDGVLTLVYVLPYKKYGNLLGKQLIELYSRRRIKHTETTDIQTTQDKIVIPCGNLTDKSREKLKHIEGITGVKILSRREPRALKQFWNTTISIGGF